MTTITRPLRLRRAELAVPGSNERMMQKAAQMDVDLVFLDLEDAVAPAEKVATRPKSAGLERTRLGAQRPLRAHQ